MFLMMFSGFISLPLREIASANTLRWDVDVNPVRKLNSLFVVAHALSSSSFIFNAS